MDMLRLARNEMRDSEMKKDRTVKRNLFGHGRR